jgi:hypothetical protein
VSGPRPLGGWMDDEIADRIEGLSPEARALFWEVQRRVEETEFKVPPDELVANLHQRMAGLPPQDQPEFVNLFRAIVRQAHEEGLQLEAEAVKAEGFKKLIERAQELDRRAGRPVNEAMTLKEAIPKLEAVGELGLLEREYLESVKDELVWVPVDEEE